MHKDLRRVLHIALVAGGLVVVGASSAYAAEGGLLDPVTQGVTDEAEGAATEGTLDAVVADALRAGNGIDARTADAPNVDEDTTDTAVLPGILGSLSRADVTGMVDVTLCEDGLFDGLLEAVLRTDLEGLGPGEPGPGEPGTGEPGTEEPGTDPGTVDPGTDGPGAGDPGRDGPGSGGPGAHGSGADRPEANGSGFRTPGGETPGVAVTSRTGAGAVVGPGYGTAGYEAAAVIGADDPADAGESSGGQDADRDIPVGGIDIGWGDKVDVVPAAHDGTVLPGGLSYGLRSALTGSDAQAAPVVAPGETLAQTGPLITGQLALVLLLLGLGLAALHMRRRRFVVSPRIDG